MTSPASAGAVRAAPPPQDESADACLPASVAVHVFAGEASSVVSSMRRNVRWASYAQDERDPLLTGFTRLKELLADCDDLRRLDANVLLAPFIEVVRSQDTSGAITSVALSSLAKFFAYGLIAPDSMHAAECVGLVADAVTNARFPSTDAMSDEVVLLKIVVALHALLASPAGCLLSDEAVCEMIQTCFRICFQRRLSEILRRTTEQTLSDMVHLLFRRLHEFDEPAEPASAAAAAALLDMSHHLTVSSPAGSPTGATNHPTPSTSAIDGVVDATTTTTTTSDTHDPETAASLPPLVEVNGSSTAASATSVVQEPVVAAVSSAMQEEAFVNPHGVRFTAPASTSTAVNGQPPTATIASTATTVSSATLTTDTAAEQQSAPPIPYGLPCVRELLRFLVSLINVSDRNNTANMVQIGLSLLTIAFETGGHLLPDLYSLRLLVADSLCRNLLAMVKADSISLLTPGLRLVFLVFESLRSHLKLQLENLFRTLMERIQDSRPQYAEHAELCLETLVQFCRMPTLVVELYLNYDCDLYCSNLFGDLTKFLSKSAFSASPDLHTTNMLSFAALLSIIDAIESRCSKATPRTSASPAHSSDNPSQFITVAEPTPTAAAASSPSFSSSAAWGRALPTPEQLIEHKLKKTLLVQGAEKFNAKPQKGIKFLQENGILHTPLNPAEVADFLRSNPWLEKKQIGDYIATRGNEEVLHAFAHSFNFRSMRVVEAVRNFLESFRLPGEAQMIDRVIECFAKVYFTCNADGVLATEDATYILSFAIMQLNTDQHHPNIKKKMTFDDFVKNQRKLNEKKDFPRDFLEDIYNSIKYNEIVMPEEHRGELRENYQWKEMLRRGRNSAASYHCVDTNAYDQDVFMLLWGPCVTAISYVFETAQHEAVVQRAISGYKKCAIISGHYALCKVFDNLVISLCKLTSVLNVEKNESLAIAFGTNVKAQLAATTLFALTRDYGNILREGWKDILECLEQLYRAHLLPKTMTEMEDFVSPSGRVPLRRPAPRDLARGADTSIWSAMSYYLSLANDPVDEMPTPDESRAREQAEQCIVSCRVEDLFGESRFLSEDSLLELVKALVFASQGPTACRDAGSVYDEETAVFFLELLLEVTVRNKDRVCTMWTTVFNHLQNILVTEEAVAAAAAAQTVVAAASATDTPAIATGGTSILASAAASVLAQTQPTMHQERAAIGVLRLCKRLIGTKTALEPDMAHALHLLDYLNLQVISPSQQHGGSGEAGVPSLALQVALGVREIVRLNATVLSDCAAEWAALLDLAVRAAASGTAPRVPSLETLRFIVIETNHLNTYNFDKCLQLASVLAQQRRPTVAESLEGNSEPVDAVDVAFHMLEVMPPVEPSSTLAIGDAWSRFWCPVLQMLSQACTDAVRSTRQASLTHLQHALNLPKLASLGPPLWHACFQQVLFPMLQLLLNPNVYQQDPKGMDEMRMRTSALLCKVFLLHLNDLLELDDFPDLWLQLLQSMKQLMEAENCDSLAEAIPESMKNVLLVMKTSDILVDPHSAGATPIHRHEDLWLLTWTVTSKFLPQLKDEVFPPASSTT